VTGTPHTFETETVESSVRSAENARMENETRKRGTILITERVENAGLKNAINFRDTEGPQNVMWGC